MTQSGGGGGGPKNTFFSVTLYNFQKSGRAIARQPLPVRGPCCFASGQLRNYVKAVRRTLE